MKFLEPTNEPLLHFVSIAASAPDPAKEMGEDAKGPADGGKEADNDNDERLAPAAGNDGAAADDGKREE